MTLKERINEDMKSALRAKETQRLSAIRLLLAAVKQREVDERKDLSDPDVVVVTFTARNDIDEAAGAGVRKRSRFYELKAWLRSRSSGFLLCGGSSHTVSIDSSCRPGRLLHCSLQVR